MLLKNQGLKWGNGLEKSQYLIGRLYRRLLELRRFYQPSVSIIVSQEKK